jgi:hypothetical protein
MIDLSCLAAPKHNFIVVDSINQAKSIFDEINNETLILIDVDSTLTTPSDPYLRRAAIHQYQSIYKALTFQFTPNQKRIFDHVLVIQSPSQLVEEDWPKIIKDLQEKGGKTLALTAAKMGPLAFILPSFPNWRYQELKRLGIDFSAAFPGSIIFEELNDWGGDHPGMEKGIVYSGHKIKKGEILSHVLKILNFLPKFIIFIDDKQENIDSVSTTIRNLYPKIKFLGIHYKGIEKVARPSVKKSIFYKKFRVLAATTKKIAS